MAMDEWLFARAEQEPDSVFARIYSWSPGAITIGLNQDVERVVDFARLKETTVIRRITGGRALYHDPGELTYSITATSNPAHSVFLGNSVQETYRLISIALAEILKDIGFEAQIVRKSSASFRENGGSNSLSCFQSAARYELVSDGRKVVGSAQRRINNTFLQHGSLKLSDYSEHPALSKEAECETKADEIQWVKTNRLTEISESFRRRLTEAFGISLSGTTLNNQEQKSIRILSECLKNNPLQKRDLIKRSGQVESL